MALSDVVIAMCHGCQIRSVINAPELTGIAIGL